MAETKAFSLRYLPLAEYERWAAAAKRAGGMPVATWVRMVLNAAAEQAPSIPSTPSAGH